MPISSKRILFVSVIASSKAAAAFPIEIGWCGRDPVRATATLVSPRPWGATSLPIATQRATGLRIDDLLCDGAEPDSVAKVISATFAESTLYSENPERDASLLAKLAKAGGVPLDVELRPVRELWGQTREGQERAAAAAGRAIRREARAKGAAARLAAMTLFSRDQVFRHSVIGGRTPEPMLQMDLFG